MRRLVLTMLYTAILAAPLAAQVFPDDEMLDVVRITDGSVLRGKIIENFVDRYVEIEIYGGSIFTVAYENIESISEVRNPDYQTQWIRVEIDPGALAGEPADDTGTERVRGEYLGDGGFLTAYAGYAEADYHGEDWEDGLDTVDARDENGGNITLGVSYGYFLQARPDVAPWWLWGLRIGFAYAPKHFFAVIEDPSGAPGDGGYEFLPEVLELPFEFLIGGGGDHLFWYFGGGVGASLLVNNPPSEYNGDELGHPTGENPSYPFHAFVRGTTGTYFRLGAGSWVGEARLIYDQIISGSWYDDFDQYYRTFTIGLGVGYHF
ncbi:MAG: hypothetical protein ACLFR8_10260 [Alkalispirochaeta sp.]